MSFACFGYLKSTNILSVCQLFKSKWKIRVKHSVGLIIIIGLLVFRTSYFSDATLLL